MRFLSGFSSMFLLVLLAFNSTFTFAQAIPYAPKVKGIEFDHTNWSSVLQKAKKEKKHIFIDCYTSWCGPCKWMAANVFVNDTVGLFYNNNFVNFKQDMEKGEGPVLSQKFQITAYPTFIFFDSTGKIVKKELGGMMPSAFIEIAMEAIHFPTQIDSLNKSLKRGQKEKVFLINYMIYLQMHHLNYEEGMNAYFKELKESELMTNESMTVLNAFTNDVFSREFQYVLKEAVAYKLKFGDTFIQNFLVKVANYNLEKGTKVNDQKRIKAAASILEKYK